MQQIRRVGVLTAGGDCQGLNAALRALVQAGAGSCGWELLGYEDGFVGMAGDRAQPLTLARVAGILAEGGTILGTGRGGPPATGDGGSEALVACVQSFRARRLDRLICLGGDGTQRYAAALAAAGVPVLTLPKTIDNDIRGTDASFGYASATAVAVEAIDRLHTTASSHHRVMLVEVMGRDAGWLAAASGLAGGADIVLLPELPYDPACVAAAVHERSRRGRHYSMLVIAEGAYARDEAARPGFRARKHAAALRLVDELPVLTGVEARLVTLGYTMRGGAPCAADRILATELGVAAVELAQAGHAGILVAQRAGAIVPVPLAEVAGPPRTLPADHALLATLRRIGVCLGD